jgi:glycosyltransferase involved in cell wall biosynthesis
MTDLQKRLRAIGGGPDQRLLRVAMLAPPWIPVPPPGYGGIESVVHLLCEGLVQRGHEVVLFAAPGSKCSATVRPLLECPHPDEIGQARFEADHVGAALKEVQEAAADGRAFDVVHDHTGFTALAMATTIDEPLVHTLHGPFNEETTPFYRRHGGEATIVALSRYQLEHGPEEIRKGAHVIPNPIDVAAWPFAERKDGYLLWIGRVNPDKGAHRAIEAARLARLPLVMAGPVQPGQEGYFAECIEPHIDGEAVSYVGEVGMERKAELFSRARALLMPIKWPEPFGMVMAEALVCGTPVIAFPEGAAPELIQDGRNGYLVADEEEMSAATHRLARIDPRHCRDDARDRFGVDGVAARYEAAYRDAIARGHGLPGAPPVAAVHPATAGA